MNTPFCLDAEKPLTAVSIWFLKPESNIRDEPTLS
jgi:hypothetical protein